MLPSFPSLLSDVSIIEPEFHHLGVRLQHHIICERDAMATNAKCCCFYYDRIDESVNSTNVIDISIGVAQFTKCNSSLNVIADTASISSVRWRKMKKEKEDEPKRGFTDSSERMPALPHNHNHSFHASHKNSNNKKGCPI